MRKILLVITLLTFAMVASAEVQVGLGTQLIQEIGTDPYLPLIGQVKWVMPIMEKVSAEIRGIGETYWSGNSSDAGNRTYCYNGLAGIGYRIENVIMAAGGGIHHFGDEDVPRAYYSMTFELNWLQRIEVLVTFDLSGEQQPMGAGFICSIGI